MASGQLLLICEEEDFPRADALGQSVLSLWPKSSRPKLRRLRPADLENLDGSYASMQAVWLVAGPTTDRAALLDALDALETWQTPVLLTRADEDLPPGTAYRSGVVIGPEDAGAECLKMLLQTLMCQGRMISQLRYELNLLQRSQKGLQGEIEKLDTELRLAARIQRQLLPARMPNLPGVEFDILFRPAGYVSGDIYDVRQLDGEHVAFYVADAVGHGVPAAMLTVLIKQSLQAWDVDADGCHMVPPDLALRRLNADLMRRPTATVQFATACYGTFNHRTRRLQLARAGHPAAILLRQGGEITDLSPDGPLLGVFDDEDFELMDVELEPGDRLLIHSDGFEVAFDELAEDGSPSPDYRTQLHDLRNGDPHDAIARLEMKLNRQSGSLHQRDDLTALVMDVQAAA